MVEVRRREDVIEKREKKKKLNITKERGKLCKDLSFFVLLFFFFLLFFSPRALDIIPRVDI